MRKESKLQKELRDALVPCPNLGHDYFLPMDILKKLVNTSSVEEELKASLCDLSPTEISERAKSTCESARCLFAVLIAIGQVKSLCKLLDEGIVDGDLPLEKIKYPNGFYLQRREDRRHKEHDLSIKTMDDWDDVYIDAFSRQQWWMLAPVFHTRGMHLELQGSHILPFITDKSGEAKSGGYSTVWQVEVHPAHLPIWDSKSIAVKQLQSLNQIEFRNETEMLKTLGERGHNHLVKLLATFRKNDRYHLMFPYADGNLRQLWIDYKGHSWSRENALWSLEQMYGIASGLQQIHDFTSASEFQEQRQRNSSATLGIPVVDESRYGRHGDIKPENILYYKAQKGKDGVDPVLRIADLGLARAHRQASRSNVDPTTVLGSPTYEPPECVLGWKISRRYDMWSMGCVYLEFVTWLLGGSSALRDFLAKRSAIARDGANDDNFFTITQESGNRVGAKVRPSVLAWFDHLDQWPNCSDAMRDLLTVIRHKLLRIDPQMRISAESLKDDIKKILAKAKKDDNYLLNRVRRATEPSAASNGLPSTGRILNGFTSNQPVMSGYLLPLQTPVPNRLPDYPLLKSDVNDHTPQTIVPGKLPVPQVRLEKASDH